MARGAPLLRAADSKLTALEKLHKFPPRARNQPATKPSSIFASGAPVYQQLSLSARLNNGTNKNSVPRHFRA